MGSIFKNKERESNWIEVAEEISGEYIKGSFFKGDKIIIRREDNMVLIDTYTVSTGKSSTTYTRLRAVYNSHTSFLFKIYRRGIFSNIGKKLGMQDIVTGNEEFDNEFIIKGNEEYNIIQLFSNIKTRDLLFNLKYFILEMKENDGPFSKLPQGVKELCLTRTGVIINKEELRDAYNLFSTVIEDLNSMGIIGRYLGEEEFLGR